MTLDSNAGGSVATGSAGLVDGDDPDYKGYLGPPSWWVGPVVDGPTSLKPLPRTRTRGGHVPPRNVKPSEEEKDLNKSCVKIRELSRTLVRTVLLSVVRPLVVLITGSIKMKVGMEWALLS